MSEPDIYTRQTNLSPAAISARARVPLQIMRWSRLL